MVVFQYGSIVLFNVHEHEVDGFLKIVERHSSGLLPEMRKDEYEVREKPTLNTWIQGGLDYIMLQYLNTDGIRTIGPFVWCWNMDEVSVALGVCLRNLIGSHFFRGHCDSKGCPCLTFPPLSLVSDTYKFAALK